MEPTECWRIKRRRVVAQVESLSERTETSLFPNLINEQFVAFGKQRVEELVGAQTELFDQLRETSRQWLDRIQSEARLASEFASQLTAARSVPDTMIVCQGWANRRLEMMAADQRHLLADYQKLTQTGVRLLSNGWPAKAPGMIST